MTDVFINAGPARAFRAPGHPQGSWALEQTMDLLAEKLGMDPVDLRLKNIPTVSQGREGSPPYTSTGLRECIVRRGRGVRVARGARGVRSRRAPAPCAAAWGWAPASGSPAAAGPPSTVVLKLFADGSVNLNMGASDIGTGTKTVMAMVVAEELGAKPEYIQIEHADTGTTQFATGSGGSKTVPTESPAVRAAAIEVKRQLLALAAEELKAPVEALDLQRRRDRRQARPRQEGPGSRALEKLKKRGVIVGVGYRGPNPEGKAVNPFSAQFCEVEADLRTGEVRVVRFLGTNDSGRVMNRTTFDNQVFGGITMGIGFALTEERVLDAGQTGKMCNRNWHDYQVPTALDVPPTIASLPIDVPDTQANTTGAKGVGEPATIPTAGAVANAVAHATGVRLRETPITPARPEPRPRRPEGVTPCCRISATCRRAILREAVRLLGAEGARVHAGGTDLLGCLRDGVFGATTVVSISGIDSLAGIREAAGGALRIGALTRIAAVAASPVVRERYPALAQAADSVGSPQLRNQGTIGGNLCQKPRCWYYRGEFDCLRKGGGMCFAAAGQNAGHCILGGSGCFMVHPSDTAPALVVFEATRDGSPGRGASARCRSRSSTCARRRIRSGRRCSSPGRS